MNSSTIISGKLYDRFSSIKHYFGLRKENQTLANENAFLRARLSNLEQELITTRPDSLRDSTYRQRYLLIPAEVDNNSIEFRNNMMTINRGSLQGVTKFSTVIEPNGIVGFIKNVGSRYSSVMSILNSNARTSVMIKGSRTIGNLVWDAGSPMEMNLEAVPKHAFVHQGDTILTTPYSHFPSGHPVGVITKAIVEPGENFYTIRIKLFNDLSKVSQVYVVTDLHKNEIDSIAPPQNLIK